MLMWFLPLVCAASDQKQIHELLSQAAAAQSTAYIEVRQQILDLGTNAAPILLEAATNAALTWQQRLVARIYYERIERANDLEALRRYDWRKDPGYDPVWSQNAIGEEVYLGKIVVPKFVEQKLWYYYIEVNWKRAREYSYAFKPYSQTDAWADWCIMALRKQPERHYLIKALIGRLESDPALSDDGSINYYRFFLGRKESFAVPVLVEKHNAFFKSQVNGPDVFPGSNEITYRGMFTRILGFADSRHADLIEKFIAEHPALEPLKGKVAEIRKRPPSPPLVEPPFRLGQELVKP